MYLTYAEKPGDLKESEIVYSLQPASTEIYGKVKSKAQLEISGRVFSALDSGRKAPSSIPGYLNPTTAVL